MNRIMSAIGVSAASMGLLAGCGASEDEQAKDSFRSYLQAAADGDGSAFCEHLSRGAKALFERHGFTCDQAAKLVGRNLNSDTIDDRIDDLTFKVSGDTATATDEGHRSTVRMVKEDGDWKVAAEPGPSGR